MKIIIYKILQHKRRYIFLVLSLVLIQSLVFLSVSFIKSEKGRFFPEIAFEIEDCFQLEINYQKEANNANLYSLVQFDNIILEGIRNIKGVKHVAIKSPRYYKNVHKSILYSSGTITNILHVETGRDFEKILKRKLIAGLPFSDMATEVPEAIVTKTMADSLNIFNKNLPQTITIRGNSKRNIGEKKCRIVGIIEDVDYFCEGKKVNTLFSNKLYNETVLIKTEKGINVEELEEKISGTVQPLIKSKSIVQLVAMKVIIYELWYENKRTNLTILSIIPLILFYSFLAIFSLFWVEVSRNKTKYGILRAIGFNRDQVFLVLIKEATFLSLISSIITAIILFNFRAMMPTSIPFFKALFLSVLSILVFVVLASLVPAIKTTKIQPAQTLSDE